MKRFLLIVIFPALLLLTGCASLNTSPETTMLSVKVATMKALEAAPDSRRAEQAGNVIRVAHSAAAWLTDANTGVDALRAYVGSKVAERGLAPSDQALADMLTSAIADEIRARLGTVDGLLTDEQKAIVIEVLAAVEQAASVYLPVP